MIEQVKEYIYSERQDFKDIIAQKSFVNVDTAEEHVATKDKEAQHACRCQINSGSCMSSSCRVRSKTLVNG